MNPQKSMPRHIIIILLNTKGKENTLKAAREKQNIINKRMSIQKITDFSSEITEARRRDTLFFKG